MTPRLIRCRLSGEVVGNDLDGGTCICGSIDGCHLAEEDQPEKVGKVYFLASATTIKIGFSTKSRKRLRDIRNHHYEKLELLGLITEAPMRFEKALHRKFAAHRLPHKREWFHRVPEIEEYAAAHHTKPWREEMS